MSRKFRTYVLPLLLATLMIAATAVAFAPTVKAQEEYSVWLKLVSTSWYGTDIFPDPAHTGFPERYNLTSDWYFVEVYHQRGNPYNDTLYAGVFYPNGTGFVKVSWPKDWDNATIVVKAKTYTCLLYTSPSPRD